MVRGTGRRVDGWVPTQHRGLLTAVFFCAVTSISNSSESLLSANNDQRQRYTVSFEILSIIKTLKHFSPRAKRRDSYRFLIPRTDFTDLNLY